MNYSRRADSMTSKISGSRAPSIQVNGRTRPLAFPLTAQPSHLKINWRRIETMTRMISGSRTSSSLVNGRSLQPEFTSARHASHPHAAMPASTHYPRPPQPTNSYPQKIEYVYVYSMEMKQELRRITADAEAVKADLRLKECGNAAGYRAYEVAD
ncbi:uncharacterized protein B0J16DRAFT_384006 [Fusarium flagelliforme]|uniref:Uncharacterized protein n=1 Tax=Fusarium flagelliforme TaxID=2675880 RepID=A0A395MKT1_9HYPO|nr:uncharacterized protein B0J16DRAFT_384006 [Fusarium flagelliforme]KAH7184946.1 hypothetical protein B0J16DRAFT_384006 [Fusarium flagelliforme]RFN47973.1 hypothetical protein FIE12Z_7696 [Fusarium flagelliforme]